MDTSAHQFKIPILVVAALIALWGIFGWLDISNFAQAGYNTDGNNTIIEVLPGSPAEEAGLAVGDYIQSLDGISTTDSEALANRGRPAVGETWEFEVERNGARATMDVTFAEPVAERRFLAYTGQIIGFCFLIFCVGAYLKRPNAATLALVVMGIGLGYAFLGGPYYNSTTARSVIAALNNVLGFIGVGALLHFMLVYPKRHSFLDRSNALLILYGPAVLAGLYFAYLVLMRPEATSALNTFTNVALGLVIVFYFGGALYRMISIYRNATPEARANQRINLLLVGTVLGLAPVIIRYLVIAVSPQTVLPGQNFYILAVVLIPITWALAAMQSEGTPAPA